MEHPAHVRVPEAAQQSQCCVAVDMWRMRVAVVIGGLVMSSMRRTPANDRTLGGDRTADRKEQSDRPIGFKRAVGEMAMKPDRHAITRQRVHADHRAEFDPADAGSPAMP